MSSLRRQRTVFLAFVCAGIFALASRAAGAEPPLSRLAVQLLHGTEPKTATPISALRLPQNRLDLAPPVAPSLFERPAAAAFPVTQRRMSGNDAAASLPSLGSGLPARIMSRPEMLARNFKREGLPIARLFQSENSLLHVGLSPKGKPGLWFVEKLH